MSFFEINKKMNFARLLIKSILLFAILLVAERSFAQTPDELNYDTSEVQVRMSDKIEDYKNDSDFDYNETVKPPVSLWEKFWRWVERVLRTVFSDEGAAPYILYTVIFLILLAVAVKLLGLDYQTVFLRSRKLKSAVDFETYHEDIHGMNLDKLILKAKANGEYQLAVRYLYLKLLKRLSEKELIVWEIDKTNLDYRKEIASTNYGKPFRRLTFLYEYIWYGDFEIEKAKFQSTETNFTELFQKLK